jgi:hypothetical protein
VALGSQRAATVLAELLPLAAHPRAYVREGVMWVLCFMPAAMGRAFTPSIATSLPVVISGLSDEAEGVREVCTAALLQHYCKYIVLMVVLLLSISMGRVVECALTLLAYGYCS